MMLKPITTFIQNAFRRRGEDEREEAALLQKFDLELTDNMRALRLIAGISEQLLSRGMAASDVVYLALGIADTYCSRKVHIDISYTIITLSLDRGIDREPLTLVRTTAAKGQDYHVVQQLEELANEIHARSLKLDIAEQRLNDIMAKPRLYGRWATHAAAGGVSAGVIILYSGNPVLWLVAFAMGAVVNMLLYSLSRRGMPSFYSQALAGLAITVIAAYASLFAQWDAFPLLDVVDPTLIIISGIVLLVAGMMIVAAFQDAIDEYYITAAARMLKVVMMTGGIVFGVTIGLYIASKLGVLLAATPEQLSFSAVNYQYLGAVILAAAFALGNQARPIGVLGAGLAGLLSLYIVLALTGLGFGVIAASGIAAAAVGFSATILLQTLRIPTIVTIGAGIIPLVPGLTLYSALTHIAQSTINTADFNLGVELLLRAIIIALVIAAGATFGNMIGRARKRRHIHSHNRLPWHRSGLRRK